ncbi:MAG: sorbosone dehydrogenase family protein [Acidobacteria bacterium]|nr:sorbosone dehydrogenase family protein [Acidobacteriota bacterium]
MLQSIWRRRSIAILCTVALSWLCPPVASGAARLPLDKIILPPGFSIAIYAEDVPDARSMSRSPNGTLFIGTRSDGRVYAVLDDDGDHRADRVITIARGLDMPNGVAFRDGALYLAENSRVTRYDDIEARLTDPPTPIVINDTFPTKGHHGWKFIRFGPDDLLYVPVGAPCNICDREDPRYASIMRMRVDGEELEIFARGVRNTVGFDWHPGTKKLWFTDNGRDDLGENKPPDELNHAPKQGMHFGYPYCHGEGIPEPRKKIRGARTCKEFTPPAQELGPHVAALGMRFYTGSMFPGKYRNQIFIAEHGSWNRTIPIGYRIMVVTLRGNEVTEYESFADGWLQDDGPWGRPVDLLVMPDGSLLVSDDEAGVIYRIRYSGE